VGLSGLFFGKDFLTDAEKMAQKLENLGAVYLDGVDVIRGRHSDPGATPAASQSITSERRHSYRHESEHDASSD
jgi:hypothetical protein